MQILLEARADPALQNARGDTPLVELLENAAAATAAGDGEEVVRLLAGRGMGAVSRLTQYGESALHVAARRNRAAAVRVILAAGADPAHQDLRGNTALHLAAGRGYKVRIKSIKALAPVSPAQASPQGRRAWLPMKHCSHCSIGAEDSGTATPRLKAYLSWQRGGPPCLRPEGQVVSPAPPRPRDDRPIGTLGPDGLMPGPMRRMRS